MRRLTRTSLLMLLASIGVTLAFSSLASAKGKNKLDGVLEGLSWGMSHEEVVKALEAKVMEKYDAEAAEVHDIAKKDRMRKRFRDRAKLVGKSYKEFKSGSRSGLEVSIVADEFVPDNRESVISIREDVATKYYFFYGDKLYKIAIAYEPGYLAGYEFAEFVDIVSGKYGRPKSKTESEDGFLTTSVWEDGSGTRLRLEDKSDVFDTFLMAFTNPDLEGNLAEKHAAARKARHAEPTVSSEIDSLAAGDDEDYGDVSAADALLGRSTDVDLRAGLPQEDIEAMADESVADGSATGDKGGTSKKKKKRRRRRRRRSKFKDIERKDKDKLIIY